MKRTISEPASMCILPEEDNIEKACFFLKSLLMAEGNGGGQLPPWGVLCIGTDRFTGDCLGPLVGSRLRKSLQSCSAAGELRLVGTRDSVAGRVTAGKEIPVIGTLKDPVHALNLPQILPYIKEKYPRHRFLAVDAALGSSDRLGQVSISPWPLIPGEGLGKSIPGVGDISITGITGREDLDPELTLPCTRLYMVDRLAAFICRCLVRLLSPVSP